MLKKPGPDAGCRAIEEEKEEEEEEEEKDNP